MWSKKYKIAEYGNSIKYEATLSRRISQKKMQGILCWSGDQAHYLRYSCYLSNARFNHNSDPSFISVGVLEQEIFYLFLNQHPSWLVSQHVFCLNFARLTLLVKLSLHFRITLLFLTNLMFPFFLQDLDRLLQLTGR